MRLSEAQARRIAARTGQKIPSAPKQPAALRQGQDNFLLNAFLTRRLQIAPDVPEPEETEYLFMPERKFAFDAAWPSRKAFLEFDGSAHRTEVRWRADIEKFNHAALLGWRGLHFTRRMLFDDPAACFEMLRRLLKG